MRGEAKKTSSNRIEFSMEELPGWLIEDMDRYYRTGEISQALLEYSAPLLDEETSGPEGVEGFPGHIK